MEPLTGHRDVQQFFAAAPESVGRARDFTAAALCSWGLQGRTEDIRLCVSELASNALAHGTVPGHGFLVRIQVGGGSVQLEVHDSRSRRPEVRDPTDEDTSGRGLLLVEALSDDWGVEDRRPFGKVVWSRFIAGLPMPTRPAAPASLVRPVPALDG